MKLEETIGLMHMIGMIVLQEFQDSMAKIEMKTPPDIFSEKETDEDEEFVAQENVIKFAGMLDFLRDSIDCYFVMCRQPDRKPFSEEICSNLLQYVSRARFNIGDFMEEIRILERSIEAKVMIFSQYSTTHSC